MTSATGELGLEKLITPKENSKHCVWVVRPCLHANVCADEFSSNLQRFGVKVFLPSRREIHLELTSG